jgi:hypothetical protein
MPVVSEIPVVPVVATTGENDDPWSTSSIVLTAEAVVVARMVLAKVVAVDAAEATVEAELSPSEPDSK